MIGEIDLSVVKSTSKSRSLKPCGCSLGAWSFIRSTMLITRTLSSEKWLRNKSTAARVSSVGTSPQGHHHIGFSAAVRTCPRPMPSPAVQCLTAASMSSHCGAGCLPATMTST